MHSKQLQSIPSIVWDQTWIKYKSQGIPGFGDQTAGHGKVTPSLSSLDAGLTAQFSLTHWGTQTNPKIMIVHLIPMYSSWLYPQFLLVTASS